VFVVESWLEHMRQHERVTRSDLAIEAEVRKFHIGPDPPRVSHFISATSPE
jgi:Transmembrane secretion effector